MRWFKHLVASGDDPDIGAIISKFGFKGYYLFFRTLEIISDEFNVENPGENTFDFKWFLGRFSRNIDRKTLVKFYDFCQNSLGKKRIIYNLNGNRIHLNFPKLKDLTDDYTSRVIRSKPELDTNELQNKNSKKTIPRSKNKDIRDKNKENKIKEHKENVRQVILYFNEKTGKKFGADPQGFISGRLNDGFTVDDCKKVIDIKTLQWLNDPENNKYLRPLTLFRPSNFEGYLNEKIIKKEERKMNPKLKKFLEEENE